MTLESNPPEKHLWQLRGDLLVDVFEDDYEHGEGKHVHEYTVGGVGRTGTLPQLVEAINRHLGYSLEMRDWEAIDDGRIGTSLLVDEHGAAACTSEIAAWKRGRMKLHAARITAWVEMVSVQVPTTEELGLHWRKAI